MRGSTVNTPFLNSTDIHLSGGFYDGNDSVGTAGYVLGTDGFSTSWVDPSGFGTNYWTLDGSLLYPNNGSTVLINTTVDDGTGAAFQVSGSGSFSSGILVASGAAYVDSSGVGVFASGAISIGDTSGASIYLSDDGTVESNILNTNEIHLSNGFYDGGASIGDPGFVLSSTGSATQWVDPSTIVPNYWSFDGTDVSNNVGTTVTIGSTFFNTDGSGQFNAATYWDNAGLLTSLNLNIGNVLNLQGGVFTIGDNTGTSYIDGSGNLSVAGFAQAGIYYTSSNSIVITENSGSGSITWNNNGSSGVVVIGDSGVVGAANQAAINIDDGTAFFSTGKVVIDAAGGVTAVAHITTGGSSSDVVMGDGSLTTGTLTGATVVTSAGVKNIVNGIIMA